MLYCQRSQYQAMLTARRHFTCHLKLWFIVIAYCLLLGLSGCSKPAEIISRPLSPTATHHASTPRPSLPATPTSTPPSTPVTHKEQAGSIWNVGVELTYTSCTDTTTIFYYWNFHIQIEHGHLVITRVGLYPTGVQ